MGTTDHGWHYAGSVAVDTGRLLLIDPCYQRPTDAGLDLALRAVKTTFLKTTDAIPGVTGTKAESAENCPLCL